MRTHEIDKHPHLKTAFFPNSSEQMF